MKNKSWISFLAVLFLFSGLLAAQPKRGEHQGKHQPMKMLELTEEQQSKIGDLKLQLQKELLPLHTKIENLHLDLKLAMTEEKFDEGKVKKIITQLSDVKKEIQIKRALHKREIRNLLTPEQQKKFDLHLLSKGERGKKGGRGFHRGRYGGPGPIQNN